MASFTAYDLSGEPFVVPIDNAAIVDEAGHKWIEGFSSGDQCVRVSTLQDGLADLKNNADPARFDPIWANEGWDEEYQQLLEKDESYIFPAQIVLVPTAVEAGRESGSDVSSDAGDPGQEEPILQRIDVVRLEMSGNYSFGVKSRADYSVWGTELVRDMNADLKKFSHRPDLVSEPLWRGPLLKKLKDLEHMRKCVLLPQIAVALNTFPSVAFDLAATLISDDTDDDAPRVPLSAVGSFSLNIQSWVSPDCLSRNTPDCLRAVVSWSSEIIH